MLKNISDTASNQMYRHQIDQKVTITKYIVEGCLQISMNNKFISNDNFSLSIMKPLLMIINNDNKVKLFNQTDVLSIV